MTRSTGPFPAGVILHSYIGSAELVPGLAKLGSYFSFSGHLTSMKPEKAKKMLKSVGINVCYYASTEGEKTFYWFRNIFDSHLIWPQSCCLGTQRQNFDWDRCPWWIAISEDEFISISRCCFHSRDRKQVWRFSCRGNKSVEGRTKSSCQHSSCKFVIYISPKITNVIHKRSNIAPFLVDLTSTILNPT